MIEASLNMFYFLIKKKKAITFQSLDGFFDESYFL